MYNKEKINRKKIVFKFVAKIIVFHGQQP